MFPNVSEEEIQAVKALTRSQSDDLKRRILQANPTEIFGEAKASKKPDVAYVNCPFCGNGTRGNNTPVDVNFKGDCWLYHCFTCDDFDGDLLNVIAKDKNLDLTNYEDFCTALAIGAILIGEYLSADAPNRTVKKFSPPVTAQIKEADTKVADALKEEEQALIREDIEYAPKHLLDLPANQRRALSIDTYKHFGCGCILNWTPPNTRLESYKKKMPPTARKIIIPTKNNHYVAVTLPADREINGDKFSKVHAGTKELFNPDALQSDLIIIVEGEFDCMSIWQVFNGEVAVCAIGGAVGWRKILLPELENVTGKKFIILFDGDEAGRKNALNLRGELIKLGHVATCKFFYDVLIQRAENGHKPPFNFDSKIDANKILDETSAKDKNGNVIFHEGDYLRGLVEEIINSAQNDFVEAESFDKNNTDRLQSARYNPHTDAEPVGISDSNNDSAPRQEGAVYMKDLMTTREVADFLEVSRKTVENWRTRKLFGCYFFTADEKHGDTLYYYRSRVEQLKSVYHKGILQDMYKLACKNPESIPPDDFQKPPSSGDINNFGEELSFRHAGFFKADEVADIFGVNIRTVERWVKNGILKEDMMGHNGDLYFAIDNILNFTPPGGDDFEDLIEEWQKNNSGSPINPKIIPELRNAKKFVDALTVDNFNPAALDDLTVRREIALCKFYAPQLAAKFSNILVAVKDSAKNQIKTLKADNPFCEIPADVLAKANISITNFNTAVKKIESEISKAQKDFVEQEERKKISDAKAARRKRVTYSDETLTNCPIKLKLPYNVDLTDNSITILDDSGISEKRRLVATTPILITKILRDPEKHTTDYEIAICTGNGNWRKIVVDGDTLFDTKKIIRLTKEGGAEIAKPGLMPMYFSLILAQNRGDIPEIDCYDCPGWHNGKFIYPAPNEKYIIRRAGINYEKIFSVKGNKDRLHFYFDTVCGEGGVIARVIFGNALVAPLVEPLSIMNPQIHLYGGNNSGKSGLMKIAAALYGDPNELVPTYNATPKYILALAAALDGLPTFLDELETKNSNKYSGDEISQMVYNFAQGKANQANRRDGTMRESFKFRGSRNSSAERPSLELNVQRGALKRLVQLHCEQLFDIDLAADLHDVAENNYGHFGRNWCVDYIPNHLDEIKGMYRKLRRGTVKSDSKIEPNHADTVVACFVAFYYFRVSNGDDKEFPEEQARSDIKAILEMLPTPESMDDTTRLIKDLQGFVASHDKFFDHENDNGYDSSAATNESYGRKFADGRVGFYTDQFKKIVERELNYKSAAAFLPQLKERGLIECREGHGYRYEMRINVEFKRFYLFTADAHLNDTIANSTEIDANVTSE